MGVFEDDACRVDQEHVQFGRAGVYANGVGLFVAIVVGFCVLTNWVVLVVWVFTTYVVCFASGRELLAACDRVGVCRAAVNGCGVRWEATGGVLLILRYLPHGS